MEHLATKEPESQSFSGVGLDQNGAKSRVNIGLSLIINTTPNE